MSESPPKFTAATDADLLVAGWDPKWIVRDPDEEGPYAVTVVPGTTCPCCGGACSGWSVVNLITTSGVGIEWHDAEGESLAEEHANHLNQAWLLGYAEANTKS